MEYALLVLACVALASIGLFLVRNRSRGGSTLAQSKIDIPLTPQAQLYKLQKSEKFWGVSVESHCSASSRLAGKKFPLESAPVLPVRECEAPACKCSYFGLPDRRIETDRRGGQDRRRSMRMESEERRAERPRRKADLVSWQAYRHL
jgi:hypothetical protein